MFKRERNRQKLIIEYRGNRIMFKTIFKNISIPLMNRLKGQSELQKTPRNSNKIRLRNRCYFSGRSRGHYRRFGISRQLFRELTYRGVLPGVQKSS